MRPSALPCLGFPLSPDTCPRGPPSYLGCSSNTGLGGVSALDPASLEQCSQPESSSQASAWRPGSHARARSHGAGEVPLHFLHLRTFQNTQEGATASDHAYPGRHPQQEPWSSRAASQSHCLGDADAQTSVPHVGLLKNPPLRTTHRNEREAYREGVWSALKAPERPLGISERRWGRARPCGRAAGLMTAHASSRPSARGQLSSKPGWARGGSPPAPHHPGAAGRHLFFL